MKALSSQKGSALYFILIAVVLFAALSYTVSNMMREGMTGGSASVSGEKTEIYMNEILDYARVVRQAVQMVRINGCSDTEISFENNIESGYVNGTNTSCQIFHPDGGGLVWISPESQMNDGSEWRFTGRHAIQNVGTACTNASCTELIVMLPNINKDICLRINEQFNIDPVSGEPPPDTGVPANKFTGAYAHAEVIGNESTNLDRIFAGCYRDSDDGTYHFYQVLIAR